MPQRLPTFVAFACLLCLGASAESISFQHNPSLIPAMHTLRAISKPNAAPRAIPGNLGKGFLNSGSRLRPRASGSDLLVNNIPAENLGLNFTYYGIDGPPAVPRVKNSLLDSILRSLFEVIPHGNSRKKH